MPNKQSAFTMEAPARYGRSSNFAFWMTTSDKKLLTAVRGMGCVTGMKRSLLSGRILVEISDDHDPDEAWHWIRKEIEDTINEVELDDIWIEAIKWIL
jgi:hypothetical protein